MITAMGALICSAGVLLGAFGMIAPGKLLQARKRLLGIKGKDRFFDSHPTLERLSSLALAVLCLIGLIKSLQR